MFENMPQEAIEYAKRYEELPQEEKDRLDAKFYNDKKGKLNEIDDYDCKKCKNKGDYLVVKNGKEYFYECECMKIRKILRNLKKSGLERLVKEYSFKNFEVFDNCSKMMREKALENVGKDTWFFIGGQSGVGKTHISTAIASSELKLGHSLIYKSWAELMRELKAAKMKDESGETYGDKIFEIAKADVLYIDDLFKAKVTEADILITWEIIDMRYKASKKTIISSEFTLPEIGNVDEAIAGRIFEKAKTAVININKNINLNRRYKR